MEDVVAVEVRLAGGERRYFLTWGRLHDRVDPAPLEALVLKNATRFSLGGTPVAARVCDSLQEAAGQPYFYECFFGICRTPVPNTVRAYAAWARATGREMHDGKHLWYLGNPDRPPYVPVPTAVVLRGWRRGLKKVSLTRAIQREAKLGLADAKRCVDRLLAGEAVTVELPSADAADMFRGEAEAYGAIVSDEPPDGAPSYSKSQVQVGLASTEPDPELLPRIIAFLAEQGTAPGPATDLTDVVRRLGPPRYGDSR